jgi:hypothetical protein
MCDALIFTGGTSRIQIHGKQIRCIAIDSRGKMNSRIAKAYSHLSNHLLNERLQPLASSVFVKAIALFLLMKVTVLWSVSDVLLPEFTQSLPGSIVGKILLLPLVVAGYSLDLFFTVTIGLLLSTLFVRLNYLTNFLLFWISVCLFKLRYPVTNGSDYVVIVLAMYSVLLSVVTFRNSVAEITSTAFFNLARWLIQLQVGLIYLISAWDKLQSDVWRSGDAFRYVAHLETLFNPLFGFVGEGEIAPLLMAWITIVFEFAFVLLIWQKRTRLFILCVGVIFHLVIWIMLSLPDFALLMILSYLIFLRDEDYLLLRRKFRRQLP